MTTEDISQNTKPVTTPHQTYPPPPGKPVFGASGRRIIYDEDGKPCRSCNTLLDFKMVTHKRTPESKSSSSSATVPAALAALSAPAATESQPSDCPPDVNELGRATWTFLHSLAATYPTTPSPTQQNDMKTFMSIFSKIYPCRFCAEDFQKHLQENEIQLKSQEEFGKWLCDAHNEVNVKLGKPVFDCGLWKQRWKDGWEDGRCD